MKASLAGFIVCPLDGGALSLRAGRTEGAEIIEGELSCASGHSFPIRDGVPRLLDAARLSAEQDSTRESFGSKWARIPNFGFEPASRAVYVNWYLERCGFGDLDGLRTFLADKRRVLDAGTGLGRDAMLYSENGAGEVFAIDLSASIDTAYRHVGHLPNVHVIQADLTALPFPERFFDYVASDGVLHHTPDTGASFTSLARHVAPGGQIAAYVYIRKGPIREFCDDFLREHYTRASAEECYEFSRAMTRFGQSLAEQKVEIEIPEDLPLLRIKAGRYDLQRFIYWNVFKCYWNPALDFETNVMTNVDWYHPQYAHRHTEDEVRGWCEAARLEIVNFHVMESGITVRARKGGAPAA